MSFADYGFAVWETFYVTVLATAFSLVIGLPLGVLLVAGDKDGVLQSMGATPFQIITKVMIPECLPGLISSMTTALTTILGYSAMSGAIGGGGLGKVAISYGYYRYQTNIMIVCVVLLILLVQAFQSVGTFWANQSDKRLRK